MLRAGANDGYSWDAARLTEQYTRDEFGRMLERDAGKPSGHGLFVHLYLNGMYWGLYNPVERPDHSFSAEYFGGEKEDWDAVHDGVASNGDLQRWNEMISLATSAGSSLEAYMKLQGRDPRCREPALPAPHRRSQLRGLPHRQPLGRQLGLALEELEGVSLPR